MTETEWAIRTLRDCVRTYVPGGLDAVLTHSEQNRIRAALGEPPSPTPEELAEIREYAGFDAATAATRSLGDYHRGPPRCLTCRAPVFSDPDGTKHCGCVRGTKEPR